MADTKTNTSLADDLVKLASAAKSRSHSAGGAGISIDELISKLCGLDQTRKALFQSDAFRTAAGLILKMDDRGDRLLTLLNALTPYAAPDAIRVARVRGMKPKLKKIATTLRKLVRNKKEGLHVAPAMDLSADRDLSPFSVADINALVYHGNLGAALLAWADSFDAASKELGKVLVIPGLDSSSVGEGGAKPNKASKAFMSREIDRALPPGPQDRWALIANLMKLNGVSVTSMAVRSAVRH